MDPLTVFVASIVGAMIEEALRTRKGLAEYYPKSASGDLEPHFGWMEMRGDKVRWYVEDGEAVWIEARYLRPISGNIFDPDKLGAVGRAVRTNRGEPIAFFASYGQIHRIRPSDVAESIAYREYDTGTPWTTGDRALDDWLVRKENKETTAEEDEEMVPLLDDAVRQGSGDLGQWTATVRDGNHRTFGSVLGGETRVAIRFYDNDAQEMREAVRRQLSGEEPGWNDDASLDLFQKGVVDTGQLPDWLDADDARRLALPAPLPTKLLPGPPPPSGHPLEGVDLRPFDIHAAGDESITPFTFSDWSEAVYVMMKPSDFLKLAAPVPGDDPATTRRIVAEYAREMKSPDASFPLPVLQVMGDQVWTHQGRHRAMAARRNRAEKIPVMIVPSDAKRFQIPDDHVLRLLSEGTYVRTSVPVDVLWPPR